MTELEWIQKAVEAYGHLGKHGRALFEAHLGHPTPITNKGVKGYWMQMSAVGRKKEMRKRGLIP